MNMVSKLSTIMLIGAMLVTTVGCGETKIVYVDKDDPRIEKVVETKMEHLSAKVYCINGYQAYQMGVNNANAWLWVPVEGNSRFIVSCNKNTLSDGTRPQR